MNFTFQSIWWESFLRNIYQRRLSLREKSFPYYNRSEEEKKNISFRTEIVEFIYNICLVLKLEFSWAIYKQVSKTEKRY